MTTYSDDRWIAELYVGIFLRAPETQGFTYWQGQWDQRSTSGMTDEQIIKSIGSEFYDAALIFGGVGFDESSTDEEYVEALYENIVSRPGIGGSAPSQSEIDYWLNFLSTMTRGEIAGQMIIDMRAYLNDQPGTGPYNAAMLLRNRGDVALAWANSAYGNITDTQTAIIKGQQAIAMVTADPATVQSSIDDFPNI